MNNEKVLEEYFIWEEKNLIEPTMKSENNGVNDQKDITNDTKKMNESKNWKTITDPKLRRKMYNEEYGKKYNKKYYKLHKDTFKKRNKEYRENNSDTIKLYQKKYRNLNKNKISNYEKKYRENNSEKIKIYHRDYSLLNRDKLNKKKRLWKEKNKNNIQYKLKCRLRQRLNNALKTSQKSGSAVRDLGCSVSELKTYLESKFQPGMTWNNWSIDGWHIDHIKPLSSFDLTDRKQLLEACHYTNLQPLWWQDNLTKSDKLL